MNIDDVVTVDIQIGSLASLIAGLYVYNNDINLNAIPSEVFIKIAEELAPYLKNWDYEAISLEEWVNESLLIAPMILIDNLDVLKESDIYFEYPNGRIIIIVSGDVYVST